MFLLQTLSPTKMQASKFYRNFLKFAASVPNFLHEAF